MKGQKKKQNGITLIVLVISIIVMLILAGVSINATIGDNGIVSKAIEAGLMSKFAGYKESAEMTYVEKYAKTYTDGKDVAPPTVFGEYVKNYIPDLEDGDVGKFALINGEFYYIGDIKSELNVCNALGINTKPQDMSEEDYLTSIEYSGLEQLLVDMNGEAFTTTNEETGEESEIGVKLTNKASGGFGSTTSWTLIVEQDGNGNTVATYGKDWYYVKKGSVIPNIGELKNSYIINYITKKAVKFEPTKHVMLSNGSNVAVNDSSLVFYADPTNMSSGDADSWGDAILHGFTETEYDENGNVISGWTDGAFVMDGVDDYIELGGIQTNARALTIEFYGKFLNYTTNTATFFTKHDDIDNFGINFSMYTRNLYQDYYNEDGSVKEELSWSRKLEATLREDLWFGISGHKHFHLNSDSILNKDVYLTFTFNPDNEEIDSEGYRGRAYLNNVEISSAIYDMVPGILIDDEGNITYQKVEIENDGLGGRKITVLKDEDENPIMSDSPNPSGSFDVEKCLEVFNQNTPYIIGAGSTSGGNAMNEFSNCMIYSLRVYTKALTAEERLANFNATTAYHNILYNGGNAQTGGNTGGGNLSDVETNG